MYKIFKRFKLHIGHRLSKHAGRCHNIHGHNFVIEVQLKTNLLNKNDMVIDFHDMKTIINAEISKYDHVTILNSKDQKNIDHLSKIGYRLEFLYEGDVDPTAEVLSRFLFVALRSLFISHGNGIGVDFVRVWENDDSYAEYSE